MRRLQVIDVGTNSVRSIIVEVPVGGAFRVIDDEKAMTRLGEGLDATGALSSDAMDRSLFALSAMRRIGELMEVDRVRGVATEAVRRASNGAEFVQRVAAETSIDLEIVPSEEEGRLVWLSAAHQLRMEPFAVAFDVGGGSVEVVQAIESTPMAIASMPIGVRVLSEHFVRTDPVSDADFKRMRKHLRKTLEEGVAPLLATRPQLVGSGGAVNAVGALIAGARGVVYESLQGVSISRAEIGDLLDALVASDVKHRLKMPGMPEDRVDVVLAGTLAVAEVMRAFDADEMLINARGFRLGVVLDTLAANGVALPAPDPVRSAREVAARYRYERSHAEHVASMALSIFDQLEGVLGLDVATRPLLEAAAVLHDVGYHIAYERHHEHSYHLIVHSELTGLTRRQLVMVAAAARYHTKGLPKDRHEAWAAVDPRDRPATLAMAAILRVADGLDRGRGASIGKVRVTDDGTTTTFHVAAGGDLVAERYGFDRKRDLYEQTFGRSAVLEEEPEGTS